VVAVAPRAETRHKADAPMSAGLYGIAADADRIVGKLATGELPAAA
jgi:hypothetical protein